MLTNYLKIAYKVLLRRPFFTFVSLFGTSITLLVLVLVAAMMDNLLAPMPPEVNLDRTLHITRMAMRGEQNEWTGNPGYGFLDRYCRDLPHVTRMAIFSDGSEVATFVAGEKIVSRMRRTDAQYWKALDFTFLSGKPYAEADVTNAAPVTVISATSAKRIFGGFDAVGREFEADGQTFRVIGGGKDVPRFRDSAFADMWAPVTTIPNDAYRAQLMGGFGALVVADSPRAFKEIRSEFESRLPHVEMTEPEHYERMEGIPRTRLEEVASETAGTTEQGERPKTATFVSALVLLCLLFMLLPAVNLINMNMSRIFERVSEIGVRKAFGASSAHLVGQFLVENVVLSLVGGLIGYLLSLWTLHAINEGGLIPNAQLQMNYRIFLYGMALSIFFGILSGVWPAWRMARLNPVDALRGGTR